MSQPRPGPGSALQRQAMALLAGPSGFAFLPALCLAAFWFGGEGALILLCVIVPLVYLLTRGTVVGQEPAPDGRGLLTQAAFERQAAANFDVARRGDLRSLVCVIEIGELDRLMEAHGREAADRVMAAATDRLGDQLRDGDVLCRLGAETLAICTAPVRRLDLEASIQLMGRLQTALEEPTTVDGLATYVTATIGFCQQSRTPGRDAASWIEAAQIALREARRRGPASIRAYCNRMRRATIDRDLLDEEVEAALENGQIVPWFQPQISTDTGRITGFEALARWMHPERGIVSPADFLPAIEAAGLMGRLAEVMMYHSFAALRAWENEGVVIPQVGVNFTSADLSDPRLPEKIAWELDRFDLGPERLAVEVLETVVARAPDDVISRTITALGTLGCRIDLDDFGTGHAAIGAIRRFSVGRIKIDRSFVSRVDRDPEQQRMIDAILSMAERLGVETLAEGVETSGEHALLSQLGCDHVQGFGISGPMPFEQTLDWITRHNAKLSSVPRIASGRAR